VTNFSTTVHCSNADPKKDTTLIVQFIGFDGTLRGTVTRPLLAGETRTITGGPNAALFLEDNTITVLLDQGSVRVLTDQTKKVICTAHVLDAAGNPPSFVVGLPSFGPNAKH
jgi:hypothetical protein